MRPVYLRSLKHAEVWWAAVQCHKRKLKSVIGSRSLQCAASERGQVSFDVRDVGVGNERYDAVRPSRSGVGSEVNNGHCKSSLCSSRPKTQLSFVIEVAKWIDPKVERIRR